MTPGTLDGTRDSAPRHDPDATIAPAADPGWREPVLGATVAPAAVADVATETEVWLAAHPPK